MSFDIVHLMLVISPNKICFLFFVFSDHIIECLNKAFDQKEEGVVIKESNSVYAPGKRIASWIKIKPDVSLIIEV